MNSTASFFHELRNRNLLLILLVTVVKHSFNVTFLVISE